MRRYIVVLLSFFVLLAILVSLSPGLLAKTNKPEFCAKCHVMEEQYLTLIKGGLHNSLKCVDCHLPNDSKAKFYLWKGIDGTKDVIHYFTGSVPERIVISAHGKKTVQNNCIRCHEGVVSKMELGERKCWECHRRTTHKNRLLIETI